jgi:DNA invertase Pin-like site-specific DNA recombinase
VIDVDRRVLNQLSAMRGRHEDQIRSLVARCVEAGASSQDIADALEISRSTLWRHYGEELRRNHRTGRARR